MKELRQVGFTGLEAKTYVELLKIGPRNARTITALVNVNRVDVYRTLRSLTRKGLVETIVANPTTYVAVPPDIAVKMLMDSQEQRLVSLKSRMKELESWLVSIQGSNSGIVEKNKGFDYTANFAVKSSRQAFEYHQRMLLNCRKEIVFVWSAAGLEMHYKEGTLNIFENCKKRGVEIRGIVEERAKRGMHHAQWSKSVEFRYLKSMDGMLRFIIVDGSELVLALNEIPDGINSLQSLSTRNSTIIRGFEMTFKSFWNSASQDKQNSVGTKKE